MTTEREHLEGGSERAWLEGLTTVEPNPQFLALVAKVDDVCEIVGMHETFDKEQTEIFGSIFDVANALMGEIMRHEPRPSGYRYSDNEPTGYECSWCHVPFPCKPFSDIESEVGK